MTNDFLFDTDTDIDISNDIAEMPPELGNNTLENEEERLNEAYDRVSRNGAMPDPAAYGFSETGNEIDDPFSNRMMNDGANYGYNGDDFSMGYMPPPLPGYDENQTEGEYNEENEDDDEDLSLLQMLNSKHVPFPKLIRKIIKPMMFIVTMSILVTTYNRIIEYDLTEISKLTKKIENCKGESIIITNELAKFCKESEVAERVETQSLGIHPLKEPAQYFVVAKYNRPDTLKDEKQLFKEHWKQLQKQKQQNYAK